KFEFTNFICKAHDKKFGEFEYCIIKSVNRTYKYISAKWKLYQLPITNLKVNLALWKKFNGFRPFLYNLTFEACSFIANPKSNPVANFVYESFMIYSNINHSCPITHDAILDKLPAEFVNYRFSKVLPFPEGDYFIEVIWMRAKKNLASFKVFGTLT
ncbi:hypothetical protein KR067_002001, partial [Drosophila pandora]